MPLSIPTDLTIVTLRHHGQEQRQRWTDQHARAVLQAASRLWQSLAGIDFRLGALQRVTEEMPAGVRSDVMTEPGLHFLIRFHPPRTGIRAFLVDQTDRPELGGQARHQTRCCLVKYAADVGSCSRMMAHEFGHLLELHHVDVGPRGPGHERQVAAWMQNLMFSGALHLSPQLTAAQVQQAQGSALARRCGGAPAAGPASRR